MSRKFNQDSLVSLNISNDYLRVLLFILNFICFAGIGQHISNFGRFSIAYPQGCAPVTIHISEHDNLGTISRQYFYEEGAIETTDTFHTYTEPGRYEVVQFLGEDIQPKTDTLVFEVLEAIPPALSIFQCSETEITVGFSDEYYDYYRVWFSETDSVTYVPGDGLPTYDYGQSNGMIQAVGYFNNAFASCPDISQSFNLQSLQPLNINSAEITEACLDDLYLQLSLWPSPDPLTLYSVELQMNGATFETIHQGKLTTSNPSFHLGTDLHIDEFCTRINIFNPCTETILFTQESCAATGPTTKNLLDSYATYSGDDILIHIDSSSSKEVEVKRKYGDGAFSLVATTQGDYTDDVPPGARPFQYRLIQQDSCGNAIDSIVVAPPHIKLTDRSYSENRIQISLSPPQNALGSYTQSLLFYNDDSSKVLETNFDTNILLPGGLGTSIHLRVRYSYDNDLFILSNPLTEAYEITVFIPSGFTPNGDGLNDYLELFGLPTNDFDIIIYDRWGAPIHQSSTNPVWHGEIGKHDADEGTYLYRLTFRLENGELKTQVGTFTLLRN